MSIVYYYLCPYLLYVFVPIETTKKSRMGYFLIFIFPLVNIVLVDWLIELCYLYQTHQKQIHPLVVHCMWKRKILIFWKYYYSGKYSKRKHVIFAEKETGLYRCCFSWVWTRKYLYQTHILVVHCMYKWKRKSLIFLKVFSKVYMWDLRRKKIELCRCCLFIICARSLSNVSIMSERFNKDLILPYVGFQNFNACEFFIKSIYLYIHWKWKWKIVSLQKRIIKIVNATFGEKERVVCGFYFVIMILWQIIVE